jgi:hypothetical protein
MYALCRNIPPCKMMYGGSECDCPKLSNEGLTALLRQARDCQAMTSNPNQAESFRKYLEKKNADKHPD